MVNIMTGVGLILHVVIFKIYLITTVRNCSKNRLLSCIFSKWQITVGMQHSQGTVCTRHCISSPPSRTCRRISYEFCKQTCQGENRYHRLWKLDHRHASIRRCYKQTTFSFCQKGLPNLQVSENVLIAPIFSLQPKQFFKCTCSHLILSPRLANIASDSVHQVAWRLHMLYIHLAN